MKSWAYKVSCGYRKRRSHFVSGYGTVVNVVKCGPAGVPFWQVDG